MCPVMSLHGQCENMGMTERSTGGSLQDGSRRCEGNGFQYFVTFGTRTRQTPRQERTLPKMTGTRSPSSWRCHLGRIVNITKMTFSHSLLRSTSSVITTTYI